MIVSTAFIILAMLGYVWNIVALLAVMAFVSFFEIGLGPIPWLIVAEMFDAKYVATAMSMACITNWACNFFVGLSFPFIKVCGRLCISFSLSLTLFLLLSAAGPLSPSLTLSVYFSLPGPLTLSLSLSISNPIPLVCIFDKYARLIIWRSNV